MGLDCSHDAFSGAYGAFGRFRQIVAFLVEGSYPPHYEHDDNFNTKEGSNGMLKRDDTLDEAMVYFPDDFDKTSPGLHEFLLHSDCDGEINPDACLQIADEMQALIPKMEKMDLKSSGHILKNGGYIAVTERFIAGCREAHKEGESLEFY